MEIIIALFRDVLDGPVYIIVSVICGILIMSCIGYLADKKIKTKKQQDQYASVDNTDFNHVETSNETPSSPYSNVQTVSVQTVEAQTRAVPQPQQSQQIVQPQQPQQVAPQPQQTDPNTQQIT